MKIQRRYLMEVNELEAAFLEKALSQGLWAAVAIFLFLYLVKSSEKRDLRQEEREAQYCKEINELSQNFNTILTIQKDIADIKEFILTLKNDSS